MVIRTTDSYQPGGHDRQGSSSIQSGEAVKFLGKKADEKDGCMPPAWWLLPSLLLGCVAWGLIIYAAWAWLA